MNEWIELINTTCIQTLTNMSPNFKYIVNSMIMQKVGCGLHMVSVYMIGDVEAYMDVVMYMLCVVIYG